MRPRAQIVCAAVIEDLTHAGEPLRMRDMTRARAAASCPRELHVVLVRMLRKGELTRSGAGYHQGDRFRYDLPA